MIAIGVGQRNKDVSLITKIYNAWKNQKFDGFYFFDWSKTANPFSFPKFEYLNRYYDGEFNASFQLNVGIRYLKDKNYQYIQIIGDDTYPANPNYLDVCMSLMDDYDIVMPKLIRGNKVIPEFNDINDKSYQDFINAANPEWQKYYNEGAIFLNLKVIEYLEGYDENYVGWGYEDKDFIERAIQAGFRIKKLDPPYHLVHSYHERLGMYSKNAMINNQLYTMTKRKKIPIKRMSKNWGLANSPKVDYNLRNELEKRIIYE